MFGITLHNYRMDGQVCIKFGVIVAFFIFRMVNNSMEFQSCWFGQEFHGVVDRLLEKKALEHQINTNLTVCAMCIFI